MVVPHPGEDTVQDGKEDIKKKDCVTLPTAPQEEASFLGRRRFQDRLCVNTSNSEEEYSGGAMWLASPAIKDDPLSPTYEMMRQKSKGAQPLTEDIKKARVALMELCYVCAEGADQEVMRLCQNKADVNARSYDGRTAMHVAAAHDHILVVEALLRFKGDPNALDNLGNTPLSEAENKSYLMEELLRKNGAMLTQDHMNIQASRANWEVKRADVAMQEELSETNKSKVFKAKWRGTYVVAKVSKIEEDKELREELLNEIHILAGLRHPDTVMFMGACLQSDEPVMFILEYMPGGDLQHFYLKKRKEAQAIWKPGFDQALNWCVCVTRALSFVHNCPKPIIHRDLKPLNLLLDSSLENLKVTDFGISKIIHRRSRKSSQQYKMTGGVGSWLYMAPEVVRHQTYTEKVDIYSFALIMYFIFSGRDPFYEMGKDHELVLKEYLKGNEPRPKISECPKQVRGIIGEAWAVKASARPDAYELTRRLGAVPREGKRCGSDCSLM